MLESEVGIMNPGEGKVVLGVGISLACLFAGRYLFQRLQGKTLPYSLEDGHLPYSSLLSIIEEIKLKCRLKLKTLRVACAEERFHVKHNPDKYEEIVLSYLVKENDALQETTEKVLEAHQIPKPLFERSLQKYIQGENTARDLSRSLDIGLGDLSEHVPANLTREVYLETMNAFEATFDREISQYRGEKPMPPLTLILLCIRSYDQVREKFPFTEFQLAAAGQVYNANRSDLQARLQMLTAKVMPRSKVRAT